MSKPRPRHFDFPRIGSLLLLLLLAGAVINVAVAWGCSRWAKWKLSDSSGEFQGFGVTIWATLHEQRGNEGQVVSQSVYFSNVLVGWPVRTLQLNRPQTTWVQWAKGNASHVPAMPLWPGFAINTLFYAAICWLLFCGPFVIRRWRRRRKGLCPACAYPVGESAVCTECGRSVRRAEQGRPNTT